MKKSILFIIGFLFIGSLVFGQVISEHVRHQLIVKIKPNNELQIRNTAEGIRTNIPVLDELNTKNRCNKIEPLFQGKPVDELKDWYLLSFDEEKKLTELMKAYESLLLFEVVQPNYIGHQDGEQNVNLTPNEPTNIFKIQWGIFNDGTFNLGNTGAPVKAGADINIKPGWDITTGSDKTVVAIIDGGIKLDHPEFSGRLWVNSKEIAGNNLDDDNNGFIDDINGWNTHTNTYDLKDKGGHGSIVAGILGATGNNGAGMAGVNWKCKLMIVNHTKTGVNGFSSSVICNAIKYASDNGAHVINMSLGFAGASADAAMQAAVNNAYSKNIVVIATMGNTGGQLTQVPACLTNVIAVGATNTDDSRCYPFSGASNSGSSYGSHISVVAPGNWILGCDFNSNTAFGAAQTWNGTSFSAPFVSGLASLILAVNPGLTPVQVRKCIETTAKDQVGKSTEDTPGHDIYMGWGRIDAYKALQCAQATIDINETHLFTQELKVFPNPVNETAFFSFNAASHTTHEIILYDVFGKEVKRISAQSNLIELKKGELSSGLYLFKSTSSDGSVNSGKLIFR